MTHRIRVVEDQEDLREIARLAPEGVGYEVLEAATGADASPKPKPSIPISC
jgi:CheY-like chemotaxis protein